jgi:hypothetical protein
MPQNKNRQEARLHELIVAARGMNIQVRTERLLRETGYRVHSGRCRVKGQDVILIDRDAPIGDQIEFLANELAERLNAPTASASPPPVLSPD